MEIVETLVLKPVPVTQMLSVKSMTHCQREQCLANVKMGTPIRMDIVRKSLFHWKLDVLQTGTVQPPKLVAIESALIPV